MGCRINKLAVPTAESLEHNVNIQQAAEFMARKDLGSVIVTDRGQVIGLFTERDLLKRVIGAGQNPGSISLGEVCSRNLVSVTDDVSCETAIKTMHANGCRRLLLYRGKTLLGIVTLQAIARELADHRGQHNGVVNFAGGVTMVAALALIALWLYQLPDMAKLAAQVMMK